MAPVVRVEHLTKDYGAVLALDALTLDVGEGTTGLVGANGAGKSTLLKILLGLVPATGGRAEVLGHDVVTEGAEVRAKVGYLPEHDCLPPDVSASDFVVHMAMMSGLPRVAARERAAEVLRHVGLAEERYRPMGGYSTGMKQKAKLAQALAHDPRLVLLDEPTNGLDPAGIREVRSTMRGLADRGKTVLVSSHILAEVQQIADTVSIVARGRLVASGRVDDLVGGDGAAPVRVGVADRDAASRLLRAAGWTVSDEGSDLVVTGASALDVNRTLAGRGLYAYELRTERADLEQVFLDLTQTEPTAPTGRRAK